MMVISASLFMMAQPRRVRASWADDFRRKSDRNAGRRMTQMVETGGLKNDTKC
jgi:hypothetical protein